MNFNAYWTHRPMPAFIHRKKFLNWKRTDVGMLQATFEDVPKDARELLDVHIAVGGQSALINLHMMHKVFSQGPKVLKLSNIDFEILENTDINLTNEEYTQPFEAMVIEFPDDYLRNKVVEDPLEGVTYIGDTHKATHMPVFATVVKDVGAQAIFVSVHLTSYDVYTICLAHRYETIQEQLERRFGVDASIFEVSLPITDNETVVFLKLIKASLNACLYVDDNGFKKLEETKQQKRLQHFVDVAKKSKDQTKIHKAMRELKSYPMYFEFTQVIKPKRALESNGGEGVGGWTCKPHWRRGFYRMQVCGVGRTERKRIRIDPVLVNSHLFAGDTKNTRVEYND